MRERHLLGVINFALLRITPAYAGKTVGQIPQSKVVNGSPPRMRERLYNPYLVDGVNGITPAYAGKTLKNPNKMAISITETVKSHLLFKFKLSHRVVQ